MEKGNRGGLRGCLGPDEPSRMWEVQLRISPVLAELTWKVTRMEATLSGPRRQAVACWLSSPTQGDLGVGLEEGMGSIPRGHMLLLENHYSG